MGAEGLVTSQAKLALVAASSNPFDTDLGSKSKRKANQSLEMSRNDSAISTHSVADLKLGLGVVGEGDNFTSAFVTSNARPGSLERPVVLDDVEVGLHSAKTG